MKHSALPTKKLYRHCSASQFDFNTTKQLDPLDDIIGQSRAREAIRFAMSMPRSGYNIYAVGSSGLGKRTMMLRYLNKHAGEGGGSSDWCYVNNFADTRNPKVIRLSAGLGPKLKHDVESLMARFVKVIPQAFDNDSYYERSEQLKNELAQKQESALAQLANSAKRKKVSLTITTPGGYRLVAMNGEEPHSAESFAQLTEQQQGHFEEVIGKLEKKLRGVLRKLATWEQEYTDKQQELNDEVTTAVIGHHLAALEKKYREWPQVVEYFSGMRKDIIRNVDVFLEDTEEQASIAYASLDKKMPRRYQVNALVHRENDSAPVVVEDNPNYHNLFGYVESITFKGTVFTDYALIRAGSLHRANGGYLLMDAIKVLEQPFVWDGLKRALRSKTISINSLERELTLSGTISLEPEPVPLDVKIILFGDRETCLLLQQYDPEFMELFKVAADFESEMPRNVDTEYQYARFISSLVHEKGLLHCDKKAVLRLVEQGSRLAEDQKKLSLHAASIANLLRESNYWAVQANSKLIRKEHVERALTSADYRTGSVRDHLYESVRDGSTLLSVRGSEVGQVNALSVYRVGESEFGMVSRVTATSRYGDGDVLDIERDVKLGGTIHSKGVMILSSCLASLLGQFEPVHLSASITFEQSYGEVDGDSATLAEYCALVSTLSGVPVFQNLAITGSMNQKGEVQPVGGLNEKIEGFYDTCQILGVTGTQGVIIPSVNAQNLMLRADVLEACKKGKFFVYAVSHVAEAVELLTGMPAGRPKASTRYPLLNKYPANSVYGKIRRRMQQIKEFDREEMEAHKKETGGKG
ncbi:MAG: ATP-dependent protease [Gammaproteobacteria bacterium]|nr:MAG: ATP-dependent protease [Pseudomonadota bacterium]PIE38991.1 MAG: ATP-dependent protease [Gammaproteobacteria bacterium]